MALRLAAALVAALALAAPAAAQAPPEPASYDPGVPTPAEVRGFATGEGFSTYRDVERVVEAIAAASDRVVLETYGVSAEGRPLRIAWVSSPGNLARLEAIKSDNRAALDGSAPTDRPILVWLSFGVHGDEASSPEAALELLYRLAAAGDAETARWLDAAVIAIDPLLNPDGHERYVAWYRSVAGPRPDPDPTAREHRPPWPAGRTNHWYFDLNRDWAWGVQPETRARRVAYLATLPQVHVDFHEMDPSSSYFFFPAADPVHSHYPESTTRWGRTFGRANAAAFDARGWAYFTAEEYDLFYPGYGDSWPSFYGATGMTYEQAGGGEAGLAVVRAPADTLTLSDRAERHLVAGLATIGAAVDHRAERLADFDAFWRSPRPVGTPEAWIVEGGTETAAALAGLLVEQGIAVDTLAASLPTGGLDPYRGSGAEGVGTLAPGALLIRADQPLGRYLATLMSTDVSMPDSTLFYDITAWTLPYLYGVAAWRADRVPSVAAHRWAPRPAAGPAAAPRADAVAVAWPYASVGDVVAAGRLAADGWTVRVAERGFAAAGRRFPAGSFVARVEDQAAGRRDPVALQSAVSGALGTGRAVPLTTSETETGIDVGSDRMRPIRPPSIAIAAGAGLEPTSVGAIRHLLEAEAGLPVEVVRTADLAAAPGGDDPSAPGAEPLELERYTAIVLPDADEGAYAAALGEAGAARLAAWVEAGGTLVGVREGAAWLAEGASGLGGFAVAEPAEPDPAELRTPQGVRDAAAVRDRIPGTIVAAIVDTTHALGWGYGGSAPVLIREPVELTLSEGANPWLYADDGPLAGYLPDVARDRLPGAPFAVVEEKGEGALVAFGDDPAFRGIVHGLKKALLNAILLVPGG